MAFFAGSDKLEHRTIAQTVTLSPGKIGLNTEINKNI